MYVYLTKVIVIAGFYTGCTGTVMGHRGSQAYFLELVCHNGDITIETSSWVPAKDVKKVTK